MKKLSITLIVVLMAAIGAAQQFTFQGKLYENGQPVTDTGTFQFLINSGGVNWLEIHNGVSISNGLYVVVLGSNNAMPLNLFKTNQNIPMEVRYKTNLIDNVTLYAPFERDYTVPDSIKDGITWSEVGNKPNLDASSTNEIQTLSLSNDSLFISQGNGVKLPTGGGGNNNIVTGSFTVQDTNITTMMSTGVTLCNTINVTSAWQSFLAPASGKLRGVQAFLGVNGNNFVQVKIHSGNAPGTQLGTTFYVSGINGGAQYRFLDLSAIPPVSLTYGQVYTVEIIAPLNHTIAIGYNTNNVDVYPSGESIFGIPNDLCFEVLIDKSAPPSLYIGSNGSVGVGTTTPTAALQVSGRIKDATGFIMPVGTVLPYAGDVITSGVPEGWLVCDGDSKSRNAFPELFAAIGTSWGPGATPGETFNLPDLRGMFLRGVDTSQYRGSQNKDPDHGPSASANGTDGKRYALNLNGNSGNMVGSYQIDQIISHTHKQRDLIGSQNSGNIYVGPGGGRIDNSNATNTNVFNTGGLETRPRNAYVHYIIKY